MEHNCKWIMIFHGIDIFFDSNTGTFYSTVKNAMIINTVFQDHLNELEPYKKNGKLYTIDEIIESLNK